MSKGTKESLESFLQEILERGVGGGPGGGGARHLLQVIRTPPRPKKENGQSFLRPSQGAESAILVYFVSQKTSPSGKAGKVFCAKFEKRVRRHSGGREIRRQNLCLNQRADLSDPTYFIPQTPPRTFGGRKLFPP